MDTEILSEIELAKQQKLIYLHDCLEGARYDHDVAAEAFYMSLIEAVSDGDED